MAVPLSVVWEIGIFALEQYKRFKDQGRDEMTDVEWEVFENEQKKRSDAAWDRFDKAKNP